MNKLAGIFVGIGAILLVAVIPAYGQMGWGMMGNFSNSGSSSSSDLAKIQQQNQQKLQQMVNDLLKIQHVTSPNKLDCPNIPKNQLEKLGDAWMDVIVPNKDQHEAMDNMMGGEGSHTLTNMHIGMAEKYLGCTTTAGNLQYNWMPMMGSIFLPGNFDATKGGVFPMMGWGNYGYGNMMSGNFGFGFAALGFLFWMVAFIDLILLGVFLWKKIRAKK